MESRVKTKNFLVGLLGILVFGTVFYEAMAFDIKYAMGIFFNADLIQIPYFAHYLIYQHGSIFNWYFPPTPYFFPDILLTLIISLFSANITHVMFSYALAQSIIYVAILMFLFTIVNKEKYAWRVGFFSALVSMVLLARGYLGSELMQALLTSNFHFGGTLMVFLCLSLFIHCFRKKRPWAHALLFSLLVIAGLSDILVLFYFVFPVCLTLFVYWLYRYFNFKVLLFYGIFLFAALGAAIGVLHILPLHIAPSRLTLHFDNVYMYQMYLVLKAAFRNMPITMGLWVSYLFVAWGILIYRNRCISKDNEKEFFVSFIMLYFVVLIPAGIFGLITIDTGLIAAPAYTGLRHFQPLILGPLFIGWPLIIYQYGPKVKLIVKNAYLYGICLLLMLIPLSVHFIKFPENSFFHYYPSSFACLDQHAKKLNLHAGLGGYWFAKPYTAFSKDHVVVAAIGFGLYPALWITTSSYFSNSNFDFIIVKDPTYEYDNKLVFGKLGQPTGKFTCGKMEIYVYQNGVINKMVKQMVKEMNLSG